VTNDSLATHPLFNSRKLKLGTFCTNIQGGTIMSSIEGQATAHWSSSLPIAQIADEMEFEAQVPVGRWRGVAGNADDGRPSMEVFTWAAAVGAVTRNSGIFATSHISILHPIIAAKQGAAVDDITNGRFALNVVCGWQKEEMEMFGTPMLAKEDRYRCAAEWLEIVKRLWSSEELVDFEGRFFKIKEGYLRPKPRRPQPPVMNAGTSEEGKHFAAKYCDMAFIPPTSEDEIKSQVDSYRRIAREEYGREIKIWSYAYIVQGDTEKDARDFYHHYVHEKGDWKGAQARLKSIGLTVPPLEEKTARDIMERFIAGGTGYPLIGTSEQIVDGLDRLCSLGLDGVLLTWPQFQHGIARFRDEVHPLLLQAGLR